SRARRSTSPVAGGRANSAARTAEVSTTSTGGSQSRSRPARTAVTIELAVAPPERERARASSSATGGCRATRSSSANANSESDTPAAAARVRSVRWTSSGTLRTWIVFTLLDGSKLGVAHPIRMYDAGRRGADGLHAEWSRRISVKRQRIRSLRERGAVEPRAETAAIADAAHVGTGDR